MSQRVVVVGDVMIDVIVRPLAPVASTSDTPSRVRLGRGGAAANIAEAAATRGVAVTFVGACGNDTAGRFFREALVEAGVEARLQVGDLGTGVVVAVVDRDAQRSMLTDRGANPTLDEHFVSQILAEHFDHLHVSGYTVLDPATRGVATMALRRARELGRSSSVDVCSVNPLREVTAQVFLVAAREASMLFANEEEALELSGASDVPAALEILSRSFSEVIVTRGPRGAVAASGAVRCHAKSQALDVLDTTGAGDAATGAYLAARLGGATLEAALEEAMAASAIVVRGLGSRG